MTHPTNPLRVGVGGPVGSGKTALVDRLCKHMRDRYEVVIKDEPTVVLTRGTLPYRQILVLPGG